MTQSRPRKLLGHVLTVVGVLLLAYLVHRIGLRTLSTTIVQFGPWYFLTCSIAAVGLLSQSAAWWLIMRDFFQRIPLPELFRVKIISDGFNMILPSASLGGDAMRAFWVREWVPLSVGVPAVLFDKTTEFIASIVFLGSGLLLGLLSLRLPLGLIVPAVVSLAVTSVGIVLLVVVQKRGVTRSLLWLSTPLPAARRWVLKRESKLLAMDQTLGPLYSRSNYRLLLPVAFHVLARCIGVIEVMVVLAFLGAPVSFIQAQFIATIVTSANTVFFLFPGQWGVTESVHVLVLQSMGFPPPVGLSLGLIRRIRKLMFVGVGLVLLELKKRSSS
ncbi:MAG: lysylphosphatidylglycerol synthase transmembrane domain-containing protein [Candidatus Methylomirabilia bacterium]